MITRKRAKGPQRPPQPTEKGALNSIMGLSDGLPDSSIRRNGNGFFTKLRIIIYQNKGGAPRPRPGAPPFSIKAESAIRRAAAVPNPGTTLFGHLVRFCLKLKSNDRFGFILPPNEPHQYGHRPAGEPNKSRGRGHPKARRRCSALQDKPEHLNQAPGSH